MYPRFCGHGQKQAAGFFSACANLRTRFALLISLKFIQMAKSAPSKKTAKAAKTAVAGGKKKSKRSRKESFGIYIHKVLKQVHPGEYRLGPAFLWPRERARAPSCAASLSSKRD